MERRQLVERVDSRSARKSWSLEETAVAIWDLITPRDKRYRAASDGDSDQDSYLLAWDIC
jgi:hypothetical protein